MSPEEAALLSAQAVLSPTPPASPSPIHTYGYPAPDQICVVEKLDSSLAARRLERGNPNSIPANPGSELTIALVMSHAQPHHFVMVRGLATYSVPTYLLTHDPCLYSSIPCICFDEERQAVTRTLASVLSRAFAPSRLTVERVKSPHFMVTRGGVGACIGPRSQPEVYLYKVYGAEGVAGLFARPRVLDWKYVQPDEDASTKLLMVMMKVKQVLLL